MLSVPANNLCILFWLNSSRTTLRMLHSFPIKEAGLSSWLFIIFDYRSVFCKNNTVAILITILRIIIENTFSLSPISTRSYQYTRNTGLNIFLSPPLSYAELHSGALILTTSFGRAQQYSWACSGTINYEFLPVIIHVHWWLFFRDQIR